LVERTWPPIEIAIEIGIEIAPIIAAHDGQSPWLRRRRSRAGGIEPPAREAG
jgi:hypothetical protein